MLFAVGMTPSQFGELPWSDRLFMMRSTAMLYEERNISPLGFTVQTDSD